MFHDIGDIEEVLKEFTRDIFIRGIGLCKFESNAEHVETVHAHPCCTIRLIKRSKGKIFVEMGTAPIEHTDVI
jgi:hypothetical protein